MLPGPGHLTTQSGGAMQRQHTDGFETLAIHAGQQPDPVTGAVVPPIYQVSTYKQDGVGGLRGGGLGAGGGEGPARWVEGYEYSRTANPTRGALEECLAALEGGTRALAFASGMAAGDCLLRTVTRPGDHVIIPHDAYGSTYRLFDKVLQSWGVSYQPVPVSDAASVKSALREKSARVVWVETPTNPLLSIADITAIAEIAHAEGAMLVVADAGLGERLAFVQNATGSAGGPFDAWLTLRGIRTLGVRMDRHCQNAARIADMLAGHPAVAKVLYPGLPAHPGHETAAKQMRGFGGIVSMRLRGGEDAAVAVCGRTRLFTLGESLGGVESLIEHPGRM